MIFYVDGKPYHLNGQGYHQQNDLIDLEVGLLYQIMKRRNKKHTIDVTSYNPNGANLELHRIIYKNITAKPQTLKVLTATPLYGRSADNLRDHRHVTSLLNRTYIYDDLIVLNPTLSFDERGHKKTTHLTPFSRNQQI